MNNSYQNTSIGTVSHHTSEQPNYPTKFCKFCGGRVHIDAVLCTYCGRQIEDIHQSTPVQPAPVQQMPMQQPVQQMPMQQMPMQQMPMQQAPYMPMQQGPVIINNYNPVPGVYKPPKDKWVAFALCFFLGFLGFHKFYEGRVGLGIVYILTCGLCGIGCLIDLIAILCKPNPYYV